MKKLLISMALSALCLGAVAQTPLPATVTVSSKGDDVRIVLTDLFKQADKSFILEPNIRFVLFLSLKEVEFEEALQLICKNAGLKFQVQNGIYFVNRAPQGRPADAAATKPESVSNAPKPAPATTAKSETKPTVTVAKPEASEPAKPATKPTHNPIPDPAKPANVDNVDVLKRRVTTRLAKVDIRELFAELGRQAKVKIEVDDSIPAYRLDAYLINTSLKFALDNVSKAARLQYRVIDRNKISLTLATSSAKIGQRS